MTYVDKAVGRGDLSDPAHSSRLRTLGYAEGDLASKRSSRCGISVSGFF